MSVWFGLVKNMQFLVRLVKETGHRQRPRGLLELATKKEVFVEFRRV